MITKFRFREIITEFNQLRRHGKSEAWVGFRVFLVSLPLSLAIAAASGFPVHSGLISAAIGGILLSLLSTSPLTIKGPGIGLIAPVLLTVQNLSVYPETGIQYTLAVIAMAGVMQIGLGLLQIGRWHSILPDSVVYGLVTAVGIMVIIHQIYYLIGLTPPRDNFFWLLPELPVHIYFTYGRLVYLGIICLLLLIILQFLELDSERILPGIFLVFGLGLVLGFWYQNHDQIAFVTVSAQWKDIFILPDFSKIHTSESLSYALTLALLGGFESLINSRTVEVLDEKRRKSRPNWELVYLGLGNILCGLAGGVPLISTLEKSMSNINYGARSRWAGFFQGLFMIIGVVLVFGVGRYIPMAVLSAIVIYYTYKLNSPKLFRSLREIGQDQYLIFGATALITLFGGILLGFLGGFLMALLSYCFMGAPLRYLFTARVNSTRRGSHRVKVEIKGAALASNYLVIKRHLDKISRNDRMIIDLSACRLVDHNFLELLYNYAYLRKMDDGKMEVQGLKNHFPISNHPLATLRVYKSGQVKRPHMHALNERQIDLQAVAAVNNARLDVNISYDGIILQGFDFANGYEIRYRENKFMKFYQNNTIDFSDVFLSKGLRMSEQSRKVSTLLITVMDRPLPDFSLSPEDVVDKLLQSVGYEDIDFKQHPKFSSEFNLTGQDRDKISAFFSAPVIAFMEADPQFSLEARNNQLLIHKDQDLMNRVELEDAIDFAERFLDLIREAESIDQVEADN
ncbi:MAG: SulP family inorganic anion transporter [Bacteroidia bacterium]|nr:SulP family inorganic anion transporter [Bacteroidia bacterium]